MLAWWESLSGLSQIFLLFAIPSSIILLIQTVGLFFGHGGGDIDMDTDVSGLNDADISGGGAHIDWHDHTTGHEAAFEAAGLRLFSVRGIFAFLAMGGWAGMLVDDGGLKPQFLSVFIALLVGALTLYLHAKLMHSLMRLQESGNINFKQALGKTATVYLTIPPKASGTGKITILLGGSLGEYGAVTHGESGIPTGALVRVIDRTGDVFVVEKEA